jgi:hypothetical protein
MRIQANTISLMGSIWGVFWYAVYALAICLIFVSKIWLAVKDSSGITAKKQTGSNFATNFEVNQNPIKS